MKHNDEAYQKIAVDRLALLTHSGLKFIMDAEGAATLLELELDAATLTDEIKELFERLKKPLRLHEKLIREIIDEERKYFDGEAELGSDLDTP